jgi:hypothetical protein
MNINQNDKPKKELTPGQKKRMSNLRPPWKPGECPEGAGRPKGSRSWHVVLRELFEQGKITQDQVAAAIIRSASKGSTKAAELIMDRMDGKAKETHVVDSTSTVIPLDAIANPQLKRELLQAEIEKLDEQSKQPKV